METFCHLIAKFFFQIIYFGCEEVLLTKILLFGPEKKQISLIRNEVSSLKKVGKNLIVKIRKWLLSKL
ncbi:hypothetical protein BpHYR1_018624 [Brachionus plicatilis]|uniref:Uncharacterized protein n=1 Tax=Brachionus plicatilis TaxID=10195 RepID=A0A3M7SJE6_BRAPC|nr:hypothetical protein BpHYR1_018624 [Brachionus plicatilis]